MEQFENFAKFVVPVEDKVETLKKLINKIYRVLPYYENNQVIDKAFVALLITELSGMISIYFNKEEEYSVKQFIGVITKLNSLYNTEKELLDQPAVKKIVLGCTNSLSRIIQEITK
jgi:hypothetical protein